MALLHSATISLTRGPGCLFPCSVCLAPQGELCDLHSSFEQRTAAQSQRAYDQFVALNHYGSMTRAAEGLKRHGLRPIKASLCMFKIAVLMYSIERTLVAEIF